MFFFPGFAAIACAVSLLFGVQCPSQPAAKRALPSVATPVIAPARAGTFTGSVSVTITTATPGAQIRYALDSWSVTEASALYSGPVVITSSATLYARAFKSGMDPSRVVSAPYVQQQLPAPTLTPGSGWFTTAVSVTMTTATGGATIRCTTDGSMPTDSSPVCSRLTLTATTNLLARAFKSGLAASNLAGGTYTISQKVASPTFTPPPGRFWESVNVNVVTATPGAVVRCTTDNTDPIESSPICGHPSFRRTTNLRARAFKAGMFASDVARATYTVPQVAAPSFSPGSMWLSGGSLSVKITTETRGAIIRYTVNGGDPTTASPIYRGPILVSRTARISARAYKTGLAASDVGHATYTSLVYPLSSRAGIFFDDFKYSSVLATDTRFTERWHVADGCGDGPGVGIAACPVGPDGTTRSARYSSDLVAIVPDDSRGILQIKTVTSGTADTTVNALVTTLERQPLQGTFAAKLWFDNPRGLRDVNAQAFLISYGADSRVNPSELAFEYLVNVDSDSLALAQRYRADTGLCVTGVPCLFMTSWRPNVATADRTVSSAGASLIGWHYLVVQVDRNRRQVRYSVYDATGRPIAQAMHRDPFFPADEMLLMINHWLSSLDVLHQEPAGALREYKMWVDWIYRDPDASLTLADVESEIAALQRDGCERFPDPDPRLPRCH